MERICNTPKVSIIIPVYGVSDYIERCIRSVIKQTYSNIECIIVDDATPDGSILKCEQIIAIYQSSIQFMILHHQQNRGPSVARNTGFNVATGEYVFFLDSDDELTTDCIEKLVRPVLKDPTIEMVLGDVYYYSDVYKLSPSLLNKKKLKEKDIASSEDVRDFVFNNNGYYREAWNRLIKKEFLVKHQLLFKEEVIWETLLWNFYLLKYLNHLYTVPYVTYYYYQRPYSITTGTRIEEMERSLSIVYKDIADNFTIRDCGREANYFLYGFCNFFIRYPKNHAFIHSAHLFKKALADSDYTSGKILLSMTLFFSKTSLGRSLFFFALLVRKIIRYRYNTPKMKIKLNN